MTLQENPAAGQTADGASEFVLAALRNNFKYMRPHPEIQPSAPKWYAAGIAIDGDRFRHNPDGEPAHLCIARDRYGLPDDLVAWLPDKPERWFVHEGTCPVLGARNLAIAAAWGDSIAIHPTPCAWITSGGEGFVVLDWDMNLVPLFDGILNIDVDDVVDVGHVNIAKRLRENFARFLPKIGGRHAA